MVGFREDLDQDERKLQSGIAEEIPRGSRGVVENASRVHLHRPRFGQIHSFGKEWSKVDLMVCEGLATLSKGYLTFLEDVCLECRSPFEEL